MLKNFALRIVDLQIFLITAQKINTLVLKNPDVEVLYGPQLRPIRSLLARLNESSEVGDLLRYLRGIASPFLGPIDPIIRVNYWLVISFL